MNGVRAEERVEALDGVRGIAILAVVLMHCAMFGMVRPDIATHWLTRTLQLGWIGVDLFFVLSGFLITGILVRTKERPHYFRNFYARRALRIFPLYYVVITLLLFVLPRAATTVAEKIPYYLYVQNFAWLWPGETNHDVARTITWSLAVEEQFYLVWPAVVWLASRRWLVRVCVAMVVGAIALRFVLLGAGASSVYFLTPCRFDGLAAGALLALLPSPRPAVARSLAAAGLAGLGVTAWLSGSSLPEHNLPMQQWGILAALPLASGLLVLARSGGWFARVCENPVLRSFGRYSYCIYLVHILLVEQVIRGWIAFAQANPGALDHVSAPAIVLSFTAMCVPVVWLAGWLSWHVFEKHVLVLKRRFES
ncbi:MAG: acyltransferase [Planctomycetes bacterium]|nr:acyltransferase [Planctomycetota bacterium]